MSIILLGHQPIDFTYKENDPCESLSSMCLQYEIADNPTFQIKNTGGATPFITIQGVGNTSYAETPLEAEISGYFYTYTINFESLGISEGCYELCVYDIGTTGSNLVTNGTFVSDLSGWTVAEALILAISDYTSPTTGVSTDGIVELSASGGTASYTYSIDGITYGAGNTFTGLSFSEEYTFYTKDSNGIIESISFEFRDCTIYAGSDAFDVLGIKGFEIKDCEAASFV